jgi:hypothetical protein
MHAWPLYVLLHEVEHARAELLGVVHLEAGVEQRGVEQQPGAVLHGLALQARTRAGHDTSVSLV